MSLTTQSEINQTIVWRCATDLELFAKYFFPHYCTLAFNTFHRNTFKEISYQERGVRRANAAPRGYAKSTIAAFIKPIHDTCYKLEDFIVIASNTDSQSVQKLRDIQAEFYSNDRLIECFGKLIKAKKVGSSDFVVDNGNHQVRFLAVGSKTEIRGIRFGSSRPSKIVLDDYEHSTEVENEEIRQKYENNFKDVFSKIGNKQTNIEIIGTILHKKSLLVQILKNPRYESKTYKSIISWAENKTMWESWTNIYMDLDSYESTQERKNAAKSFYLENQTAMDKGTEVLWPQHESYYELQEEIIESGLRSFMKEKQNSPMSDEDKIFHPEKISYYTDLGDSFKLDNGTIILKRELLSYGVIDPATGQSKAKGRKKNDFTCILVAYADKKGRVFIHYDYTKRVAPSEFIGKVFDLNEEFDFYKFGVETNLYKNLLIPNLLDERKRREKATKKIIKIPFYEIDQVENKQKRIFTLEPKVEHRWIMFNKNLTNEFFDQMFEFPKGDHDDCCFVAGTLISTPSGHVAIERIKKGDKVMTPFGERKVLQISSRVEEVISNVGLRGTANHHVFTNNKGFVELRHVEDSMVLDHFKLKDVLKWKCQKLLNSTEKNIKEWAGRESIIFLQQQQMQREKMLRACMLQFGNFITKKEYLRVMSFTIKMTTLLITTLKIFLVFHTGNIAKFIAKGFLLSKCQFCVKKLKNGIEAKMAESGIDNMLKRFLTLFPLKKKSAHIAERPTKQEIKQNLCFVQLSAEIKNITKMENICQKENVLYVEKNLKLSNQKTLRHVADLAEIEYVYNLTIDEDGVYYANDILVSNCDAAEMAWSLVNNKYKAVVMDKAFER